LHPQEIRGVAIRLGMENFEDVIGKCDAEGGRVSYIDFSNELKQKYEPGAPVVYSGAPKRPRRKKKGMGSPGGRSARLAGLDSCRVRPEKSPTKRTSPQRTAMDGIAAFADEFGRLDINRTGMMGPGEIRAVCRKVRQNEERRDGRSEAAATVKAIYRILT